MELRHLRYFCAVADEMNITRAAGRLGVAQPALTQQIKALEAELKAPLLRRVGRGIELTQAGALFWREATDILERVRAATLATQEASRGLVGRLRIGLTETASFAKPVTALLKRAREHWPRVELSLTQSRSVELVNDLLAGRLDLAFIRSPLPPNPSLASRVFLTEGFVVVLPKTHDLAARPAIPMACIAGERLILTRGRQADDESADGFMAALKRFGPALSIGQRTPEYVSAINLVAAGSGVTVVPSVLTGLREDAVAYRPLLSSPALSTQLLLIKRRDETSPLVANFLDLDHGADQPDAPRPPKPRAA